jgi:uncharacterized cupredoxin-like copper-binding protein
MRQRVRFMALPLLTVACSNNGQRDRRAAELPLVRLEAHDFAFTIPAGAAAGLTRVRLVNRGPGWHEANIARLPDGETTDSYLAGARTGNPFPAGAVDFGGPGKVAANDSSDVVIDLEPGRYAVVCWHDDHVKAGMIATMVVAATDSTSATGSRDSAAAPAVTAEVALEDFRFTHAPETYRRGHNVLRVRNVGQRPHDMTIYRLQPGRTIPELSTWYRSREGEAPALQVGGMVTLAPGKEGLAEIDFEPGSYLVACGTPEKTPEGIKIHAQMGMAEAFDIK